MEKKILGIIIISIFFLIIYKKESFISTGIDKIFINNVSNKKSKEKIIETSENVNVKSTVVDETYTRIIWIFVGVITFVFLVINYKSIPSWFKSIKERFKKNNDSDSNSDDLYDELNTIGGNKYYMGGYDINDYSE